MRFGYHIIPVIALLGVVLLLAGQTHAQDVLPSQAGLVVQFGDGRVTTVCVDLGPDRQATGLEVLTASGLQLSLENTPGYGAAVCKIEQDGCTFPVEACFCACTLGGGEACRYWSYSRLIAGRWQYSQIGAGRTIVQPGDVEGWAWGAGTVSSGSQPPLRNFAEICSPPTPMPQPTTLPPPSPATPTLLIASPTLQPLLATTTPTLPNLPSTSTPTLAPTATPVATQFLLPTASPTMPVVEPEGRATQSDEPAQVPQVPTATSMPEAATSLPATPVPTPETVAQAAPPQPAPSAAPGTAVPETPLFNYLVFGVLVVVLAVAWGIVQRRR